MDDSWLNCRGHSNPSNLTPIWAIEAKESKVKKEEENGSEKQAVRVKQYQYKTKHLSLEVFIPRVNNSSSLNVFSKKKH